MKIDVLVAEIGSTTTVVNAFDRINGAEPVFLGQGQAPTSVLAGDVRVGLQGAVDDLCRNLGAEDVQYETMLATSSAAGGLRMTVHGLVYDMTVKAAKEAALGAGANLHLTTAGVLEEDDLEDIRDIRPNLILLAGGTDYGERQTALENAKRLRGMDLDVPVIYAGNVQNQNRVRRIFEGARAQLYITENVYPRLDELNIEPTRRIIHQVFEEHIIKAPGMEGIRDMVTGSILPTPGAVMECAKLLHSQIGDLLVLDVGGATTDIHSVTEGSEEIALIQITPEPMAKRTVEGDLGVYVNAKSLAGQVGMEKLSKELGLDVPTLFADYRPIPATPEQFALTEKLTWYAASMALERHCGKFRYTYGSNGRVTYADGKDLTKVRYLVATGGALTRLPGRKASVDDALGLDALEQALSEQPAASQGQHSSGLLVALAQRTEAVVKEHMEPVHPVLRQLFKQRQKADAQAQPAKADDKPVPRQPGRQSHSGVNHQIHQPAACVLGDHIDPYKHESRVSHRKKQGSQAFHLPVVPEPGNLSGKEHREGQANDLRRLDVHGEMGNFQPGTVAIPLHSQRRTQQSGNGDVKQQKQPPFFRKVLHIQIGKNEVRPDADHRSGGLNHHPLELSGGS